MKQFSFIASAFAGALMLATTAFATNAPYNWTGFYAGINAGGVNNSMDITDTEATSFQGTIQQVSDPAITGGFQGGYRRQLDLDTVSGVYGIEGSFNIANAQFSKQYGSPFATYQFNANTSLKIVTLLEFTGGIAAGRTYLFLCGGLAWVRLNGQLNNVDSIGFFQSVNLNQDQFGHAIGAGIEYAFTDKISARIKVDAIKPNTYTVTNNTGSSYEVSDSLVLGTLGVNYKFA